MVTCETWLYRIAQVNVIKRKKVEIKMFSNWMLSVKYLLIVTN